MDLSNITINEIITAVIAASFVIEIAPIKINPWGWLLKKLGKEVNADLIKKIDGVDKELKDHIKDEKERQDEEERMEARKTRTVILEFDSEVRRGVKFTKEHWDNFLIDYVGAYESYCASHAEFPNNVAEIAIKNVKDIYEKALEADGFLK